MGIIPNVLSFFRLIGLPFTLQFLVRGQYIPAIVLHSLCGFSDLADGYLARRWNCESRWGSLLDSSVDKIYSLAFFSTLATIHLCSTWYVALLITMFLLQLTAFAVLRFQSKKLMNITPSLLGKWTLALQFIWGGFLILSAATTRLPFPLMEVGYVGIAGLQATAIIQYFIQFRTKLIPITRLQKLGT